MRQFERSLIAVACIRGWLHSLPERRRCYAAESARAAPLSLLQEEGSVSDRIGGRLPPRCVPRLFAQEPEKLWSISVPTLLSTSASGDISRMYVELQMAPKRLSLFFQFLWHTRTRRGKRRCGKLEHEKYDRLQFLVWGFEGDKVSVAWSRQKRAGIVNFF
jgi:hypothetical protein